VERAWVFRTLWWTENRLRPWVGVAKLFYLFAAEKIGFRAHQAPRLSVDRHLADRHLVDAVKKDCNHQNDKTLHWPNVFRWNGFRPIDMKPFVPGKLFLNLYHTGK
jgi:hypothetical protein